MAWQDEMIPADMTVEHQGQQVPFRDIPFVKEAPDFQTFLKMSYDTHREVGSRIPLRVDKSKPETIDEWKKTHLPRLYEAGVLSAPPKSIDEYGAIKPENLPEGLGWNEETEKKFKSTLLKYGVPKEAVGDLLQLHLETLGGTQELFKTDYEQGMTALKAEHGDKLDSRMEAVKRLTPMIFKDPKELELFEKLGLGNHPGFLNPLLRLAHLAESDSSFVRDLNTASSGMAAEEVRAEMGRIMSDKTHPLYEGYHRNDPATMAKIDEMYKKAHGSGTVQLGGGITIGGPRDGAS